MVPNDNDDAKKGGQKPPASYTDTESPYGNISQNQPSQGSYAGSENPYANIAQAPAQSKRNSSILKVPIHPKFTFFDDQILNKKELGNGEFGLTEIITFKPEAVENLDPDLKKLLNENNQLLFKTPIIAENANEETKQKVMNEFAEEVDVCNSLFHKPSPKYVQSCGGLEENTGVAVIASRVVEYAPGCSANLKSFIEKLNKNMGKKYEGLTSGEQHEKMMADAWRKDPAVMVWQLFAEMRNVVKSIHSSGFYHNDFAPRNNVVGEPQYHVGSDLSQYIVKMNLLGIDFGKSVEVDLASGFGKKDLQDVILPIKWLPASIIQQNFTGAAVFGDNQIDLVSLKNSMMNVMALSMGYKEDQMVRPTQDGSHTYPSVDENNQPKEYTVSWKTTDVSVLSVAYDIIFTKQDNSFYMRHRCDRLNDLVGLKDDLNMGLVMDCAYDYLTKVPTPQYTENSANEMAANAQADEIEFSDATTKFFAHYLNRVLTAEQGEVSADLVVSLKRLLSLDDISDALRNTEEYQFLYQELIEKQGELTQDLLDSAVGLDQILANSYKAYPSIMDADKTLSVPEARIPEAVLPVKETKKPLIQPAAEPKMEYPEKVIRSSEAKATPQAEEVVKKVVRPSQAKETPQVEIPQVKPASTASLAQAKVPKTKGVIDLSPGKYINPNVAERNAARKKRTEKRKHHLKQAGQWAQRQQQQQSSSKGQGIVPDNIKKRIEENKQFAEAINKASRAIRGADNKLPEVTKEKQPEKKSQVFQTMFAKITHKSKEKAKPAEAKKSDWLQMFRHKTKKSVQSDVQQDKIKSDKKLK